jgi:predicted RNA-binding Zn ribbon-like protein
MIDISNLSSNSTLEHVFDFVGGVLCLDFANTWGGLPPESVTQERLTSFQRLVAWGQQANIVSEPAALALLQTAERNPEAAAAALEQAIVLREAMRSILAAVALGSPIIESDLDVFNAALGEAMAGARMVVTEDGFDLAWREADAFDQILAPVARSTATLLTSAERQWMRECANPQCHWLFVDTTKNHRRQWCRTNGCGNMMRVRKHRERQRDRE